MEVVNTVGRRKAAVARVFVKPGKGQITINHKELAAYFPLEILQFQVKQPLLATNTAENYDIVINLDGGGIKGQAEAARLGIARALCEIDAEMRPVLKKAGFLTRDPREVERKKPGQPGARRTDSSRAIPARLSVRSPDSPEHVASSSSASVNTHARPENSASTASVSNRKDYLYYILRITARLPRRGKPIGTSRTATRRVEEKRIKINQRNELKCHAQILIHYWKPVRTSDT